MTNIRVTQAHLVATGVLFAVVLISHIPTLTSLVAIWRESDTFVHGFIIAPIVLYLVWQNRESLRNEVVSIYWPGLVWLAILALAWWLSTQIGVQVGAQFAVVAMIPAVIMTMMGARFTRKIAFPLAYLVFAVPFGEALIPWLMDITATFTVEALQLSGIPVIRDGRFFAIPAGNFEVAKACSGIRYMLATLALGTLYGYLSYRSYKKRVIFFIFSFFLPIVANCVRAFIIVLIAHYSEMRLAVGVDHIIFGWIFFGLVVAMMFWIGHFYRDDVPDSRSMEPNSSAARNRPSPTGQVAVFTSVAVAIVAAAPLAVAWTDAVLPSWDGETSLIPRPVGAWMALSQPQADWRLAYGKNNGESYASYRLDGVQVDLAVAQYRQRGQGAELANAENDIVERPFWKIGKVMESRYQDITQGTQQALSAEVQSPVGNRLIWYWYDINGTRALTALNAKLLEVKGLLIGLPVRSSVVAVSVQRSEEADETAQAIENFLMDFSHVIDECLRDDAPADVCQSGFTVVGQE